MFYKGNLQLLLIAVITEIISAEKILFIITLGSRSHRFAMQPLAVKLADLGHQVSFLAAVKPEKNDTRISEVLMKKSFSDLLAQNVKLGDDSVTERLKGRHNDYLMQGTVYWDVLINAADAFLRNKDFVKFVTTEPYDLVVGDFTSKELAVAMAYKMEAKVIFINTGGALHDVEAEIMGLPIESYWLPDFELGGPYWFIPNHLFATLNSLWWYGSYKWYCLRKMDLLIREHLGKDVPPLEELLENIDLMLLNERFPYAYPRSLPPFAVPVGGMHVRYSDGVLPKEIEEFIGKSEHFVFISLGSIINVNRLPAKLRQNIFDAIASFENVRFLWKWDGEVPNNIPQNVMTMAWFPQQEILANPKCKGFVTQGGAMSFQQGIYHGKPMIVIPIWWDQPSMARSAAHNGVGIHLELSEISRESFQSALHEIIFNEKYKIMATKVSQRAKDQPMPSVELAAWWVEYILRHNTSHFKSPSMKQSWWQKRLLDVWFIVYTILLITIVSIYKAFKCLMYSIRRNSTNRNSSKGKKVL